MQFLNLAMGCCTCDDKANGVPPAKVERTGVRTADLSLDRSSLATEEIVVNGYRGTHGGAPLMPWSAKDMGPAAAPVSQADLGIITGGSGEERVTYQDGSSYVGQVASGRRHGHGTWMSEDEQYTGQWQYDRQDGTGRATWQDGRVFEGCFLGGRFHGYGRMEWHAAGGRMCYEGQYVEDSKHGQGRFIWPDGRTYEGDWVDGKRHGQARFRNVKGQEKVGIWHEDNLVRWLETPGM